MGSVNEKTSSYDNDTLRGKETKRRNVLMILPRNAGFPKEAPIIPAQPFPDG